MSDPYKVLGVSPNASDEEIKTAYRELAKKYHPDAYVNNPLADLALEKMQEINEAYDTVTKQRAARSSGSSQSSYGGQSSYGNQSSYGGQSGQYADVRRLIQARRVAQAEELLDGIPEARRDAEWYFLKGHIHYARGWLDEAFSCFGRACQMNPQNLEYRNAYNRLAYQRNTGRAAYGDYRTNTVGSTAACDLCTNLICADCCCECLGGDLISCC